MCCNGKIYIIRSFQTNNVYVGSTVQKLNQRLQGHKQKYKLWKNGKHHFLTSFEILKYEDAYIELIENYPCNSKEELFIREGEVIRQTDNTINICIAGRTQKQYYAEHKDEWIEKNKNYYDNHKNTIIENQRQYRKQNNHTINCECGGKYVSYAKPHHIKTIRHKTYLSENGFV